MKHPIIDSVKIDAETGLELRRGFRKIPITYKGITKIIDMPGWYSSDGKIGEHSAQDMKVSDRALNCLKAKAEGLPSPDEIRSFRKKFKLSQVQAGTIIGGGIRAFQKYESGDILPSRTLANLLLVLKEYPKGLELLKSHACPKETTG